GRPGHGGVGRLLGGGIPRPRHRQFRQGRQPPGLPRPPLPIGLPCPFNPAGRLKGFNGGSTFAGTDFRLAVVITNTILASAFGCLSAMFVMWRIFGKPDPSMSANGLLAGLVAITAPCAYVAPWAAMVIGIVAGWVVVGVVVLVERVAKV